MNRYALSIIHFQNSIVFQVCTLFYETVVEISVNVTLISLGNYVYECGSIKCCNGIFRHSILLSYGFNFEILLQWVLLYDILLKYLSS